jgi:hypothetical protein
MSTSERGKSPAVCARFRADFSPSPMDCMFNPCTLRTLTRAQHGAVNQGRMQWVLVGNRKRIFETQ